MSGILAARNPLNVLRTTVAPALRRVEEDRPNVIPGILAGALESWPVFNPTVGGVLNPSEAGKAIVGAGLWDQLQAMDRMPPDASLADWRATQGPLQQAIMDSPIANPFMAGMTVYHGSPHQFDRFDLSKVGTGEGAQAYGWGAYFAESPNVAGSYRAALSKNPFPDGDPRHAAWLLMNAKGDDAAQKFLQSRIPDGASQAFEEVAAARSGSMYQVDIPDELIEGRLLDWDAPLSEQPEAVRKAVEPLLREAIEVRPYSGGWGDMETDPSAVRELFTKSGVKLGLYSAADAAALNVPGSVVIKALGKGDKESWRASEALLKAGIPGLRYFDGQSRGAGEGTRNLVIWAQDILDKASVLRK